MVRGLWSIVVIERDHHPAQTDSDLSWHLYKVYFNFSTWTTVFPTGLTLLPFAFTECCVAVLNVRDPSAHFRYQSLWSPIRSGQASSCDPEDDFPFFYLLNIHRFVHSIIILFLGKKVYCSEVVCVFLWISYTSLIWLFPLGKLTYDLIRNLDRFWKPLHLIFVVVFPSLLFIFLFLPCFWTK